MIELTPLQNILAIVARILFVSVFVFQDAFYNKIIHASRSIQYMKGFNLPCPHLLLVMTVVLELLSGFMIISGWQSQWGAFLLLCFTLCATCIFHRFWTYDNPQEFQNQLNHFMKNISIMGGALFIIVFGVGHFCFGYSEDIIALVPHTHLVFKTLLSLK